MTTPSQNPSGTQTQGGTNGGGLKESAAQLAEQAKSEGKRHVDTTRQTAADSVEKLARSARAAASELQQDDVGHLSQYIESMADGLNSFASRLREKNGQEIAQEVARLARENPALFVGGTVALGFGLARFARAKPPGARRSSESGTDSWAGSDSDLSGTSSYAGAGLGSSGMDATGSTGSGAMGGSTGGASYASTGLDSTASSHGSDRSTPSASNLGGASGLNDGSGYSAGSTGSTDAGGDRSGLGGSSAVGTVGTAGSAGLNTPSGSGLASGSGAQAGPGTSGSDHENRSSTSNRGGLNS